MMLLTGREVADSAVPLMIIMDGSESSIVSRAKLLSGNDRILLAALELSICFHTLLARLWQRLQRLQALFSHFFPV
jgi:hypothetical protein